MTDTAFPTRYNNYYLKFSINPGTLFSPITDNGWEADYLYHLTRFRQLHTLVLCVSILSCPQKNVCCVHIIRPIKCPYNWVKICLKPYSKVQIDIRLMDILLGMIILNQYEPKLKLLNNF